MLGELIAKFRAHMDEGAANAAVEKYHTAFSDAATVLDGLTPELDEALLSVAVQYQVQFGGDRQMAGEQATETAAGRIHGRVGRHRKPCDSGRHRSHD